MKLKVVHLPLIVALVICLAGSALADTIKQLSLITNDLVYDKTTDRIYASVPSSAGVNGNSIACINPYTGQLLTTTYIGSEPGKLAISPDGRYLYAALGGSAAVRRFDTVTLTAGLQFSLGSHNGPNYAEDIAVMPGHPDTVAVSRMNKGYSPRHEGVAVYDSGVMRPTTTPSHTGSNVIEFSDSASTLYGYNNETTDFGFRTMSVDTAGVTTTNTTGSLITGFSTDIAFDGGRIYATSGRVIDPVTRTLLGTFSASGPLASDSKKGRTFFVTGSGSTLKLTAYSQQTYVPLGSLTVTSASGSGSSLIRWGTSGLAFRTSANQVFLVNTTLVPEPGSLTLLASLLGGVSLNALRRKTRRTRDAAPNA